MNNLYKIFSLIPTINNLNIFFYKNTNFKMLCLKLIFKN